MVIDVEIDGSRDLLITNGFPKDVTDRDYVMFKREVGAFNHHRSLIDSIPVLKISNYGFKNNDGTSFSDMTKEWGLFTPSFSNGAAFADLDNDGDLDYVVNNINDPAFLYENTLYQPGKKSQNTFLRIKLQGDAMNPDGLGAINNWWNDGTESSSAATRQKNMTKYYEVRPFGATTSKGAGPNYSCTTNPITPLTDVTTEAA